MGEGFADPRIGPTRSVYLLSDFALSRERRLSKLIAMLATGQDATRQFDRRRVQRTQTVVTTAFTDRPVSMKYRGIFELYCRTRRRMARPTKLTPEAHQRVVELLSRT